MSKRSVGVILLLGFVAFAIHPVNSAQATALTAGGFYQFEDHSSENHSNETLDGIDLSFGSFANSNIKNSSFVGAIFEQTDFSGANLQGVDMTNADLTNATFSSGANLKNADLTGANLVGIDLTGVNIQNTNFTGAWYDGTSVLPFDPTTQGMVAVVPEISPLAMLMMGLLVFAGTRDQRGRVGLTSDRGCS